MEVMFERVAGLDVGKASVTVCVRTPSTRAGRRRSETRTFPTMTRSLGVVRDWLVAEGVTVAAIESTSTYWKAPFYCLEEVMDAIWIPPQRGVSHGDPVIWLGRARPGLLLRRAE